jgi:pimeloyl-ACP methyl ester carboxylesterase
VSERREFETRLAGGTLHGCRWDGAPERNVLLLHAGICDSRSWERVAPDLTDLGSIWAYDRPGHGSTPPAGARDHIADLTDLLDANVPGPVWLVGSSMGGAVALDVAVTHPERVAGLVLLAPGITGQTESTATERELWLDGLAVAAAESGDVEAANRYEIWYWLDGPAQAEGRVGGASRVLALEMNRTILAQSGESGLDESADAWAHLGALRMPVTVAIGEYDATQEIATARALAERVPGAAHVEISAAAHLPYLERPDEVGAIIRSALS